MTDLSDLQADAVLAIDLDAIVANWRLLRERCHGAQTAAVVKADAYGLGAERVGPALAAAGCRLFFVAQVGEAAALRAALDPIDPDRLIEIAVFNGVRGGTLDLFTEHGLTPVLNDAASVALWLAAGRDGGVARPAILHLDTGMNRLGIEPAWFDRMIEDPDFLAYPWRALMTHLG